MYAVVSAQGACYNCSSSPGCSWRTESPSAAARRQNGNVDKPEDATHIDLQEPVSLNFALRYMNSFAKATPLSNQVRMVMGGGSGSLQICCS